MQDNDPDSDEQMLIVESQTTWKFCPDLNLANSWPKQVCEAPRLHAFTRAG